MFVRSRTRRINQECGSLIVNSLSRTNNQLAIYEGNKTTALRSNNLREFPFNKNNDMVLHGQCPLPQVLI